MQPQPFSKGALLARIPEAAVVDLARSAEECRYRHGDIIFERADRGDAVYAIVSGQVKVYLQHSDGSEILVAMRGPGEVLGEMSLLDGRGRSASASAYDNVSALKVSRERFQEWLQRHPAAAWVMLEALSQRLREATDQVGEIALLDVEARIARRLWQDFQRSSADVPATGAKLRVNQGELASMLGLTRESVNKHLSRLRGRNIIGVGGGHVELLDPAALRALAESL
jgi:CRP-like cAMP-binding protein